MLIGITALAENGWGKIDFELNGRRFSRCQLLYRLFIGDDVEREGYIRELFGAPVLHVKGKLLAGASL